MTAFIPQPQSIIAVCPVFISRHAEGRRLSWPGEIPRWFAHPKTVTYPAVAIAAAAGNRTHDH